MKKLVLPLLLCLLFTGCSNLEVTRLNKNVLGMFYDIDYVDPKLFKQEKKLIEQFRYEQKPENLVIELDEYFDEYNLTDKPNTLGVYQKDGKYYIKYKDITFIEMGDDDEVGSSTLALVNCNGYEIYLSKDMIPILYYETKDSPNYKFSYIGEEETEEELDVKYISYANDSGLIIRYIKENNKITDIKLKYTTGVKINTEFKDDSGAAFAIVSTVTFVLGGAIVGSFIIKRVRLRNV